MIERITDHMQLEKLREEIIRTQNPEQLCITVCCGTGCSVSGATDVMTAFEEELQKQGLEAKIATRTTGCHGFCERGPLVVIYPKKIFYQQVNVKDVPEIVTETICKNNIIERLLYVDPTTGEKIVYEDEVPFYRYQSRLTFGKNGLIDPTKITDYIALGGYSGLAKVISEMTPEDVIFEIKESGLRGRGGAGFPTGKKWEICRKQKGDIKYIICNGDEGDPGAFMDRSLLEGNPHSVLEGMVIGGYAIGAINGYIYVRDEYPLAVKNFSTALEQAREYGLLGNDIMGSNFSFDIKLYRGAGAFVCGEETGLIASIEGKTGEPRPRPPYPAEKGLWGKPTNINNVKTWANVPLIINKGAEWFRRIGTKTSKGTMIFSLVGKINNTGLVEVPMGISLKELIYKIGGGIPGGKKFKAVQTGGPSGGCIPESLIDLTIDYEELTKAGSMMGSGGMIVMDENTCMVDTAHYFLKFTQEESCGKCVPCRVGTRQMLEILERIKEGNGKLEDIKKLEMLGETVKLGSLCGLGQTASNPVLSTLRYFKDEYIAHIKSKKCPAGVCKALIEYVILSDKCTGCGACSKFCPENAISGKLKEAHKIDKKKCIKCGGCIEGCKFNAITIK